MLGVVFTGGEGPAPEISRSLAAGADLVAAADSGLLAAEAAGIRPDWVVGDMDSLDDLSLLDRYSGRVVSYPREKDYTDTELGLSLLWEKGCGEVWIFGGGGGRLDHLFAIRALFERERCPRRWLTARDDIWALEAGTPGSELVLEVNFAPGTLIAAAPLGEGPWKALSRGLKWPLDNVAWNRGFFGACNEAAGDTLSVSVAQGRFMLLLPLEGNYVRENN
jgi:thiamine pyrophosphokinase